MSPSSMTLVCSPVQVSAKASGIGIAEISVSRRILLKALMPP
jgi:hypothetical protein